MLLPCGIDVFSGVEFVCCPKNYKGHGKARPMEVEEPVALPQMDHRAHQSESTTPTPKVPTTTTSQEVGTRDEYFSRFDPHEEHDAFRRAEQRLEERHREKVSKIMKEWSDLEERYQDLRAKDPRGAEEFKHRMTQRFQQTVEAVEAENEAERHQLTALHQQRIVAHINEMKREAMTCYTRALAEKQPNTHKVQKCLQKLLRALNKDRHHTVSHYKHLLNSDYEAADRERDATLQHLSDLERMVNQSLNMLTRHADLNAKIGRLMREYSAALRSKDSTPPELSTHAPLPISSVTKAEQDAALDNNSGSAEEGDNDEDDDEDDVEDANNNQNRGTDDSDDEDESGSDETFPEHAEANSMTQTSHTEALESQEEAKEAVSQDPVEVDTLAVDGTVRGASPVPNASTPPEPLLMHHAEDVQVAHAQHHQISHSQASYSVTRESSSSESRGVYFTVAFAGVALMMAMVVGIVVLRLRNSTNPHNQGFMEVDQAITPEERHVANMQVNGYENPTYKYFEEK